ncbi:MAG TPA: class I SAM-dependent methyltransferase [Verrucomicrobiae bacterium]|nr:class I SAM-dependent methyltransferase [Verrucomicrobiae bacterium]
MAQPETLELFPVMTGTPNLNEYATAEHALRYLARADRIPHRTEGEAVLLEFIPQPVRRMLDLGTGDGRLLALLRIGRRDAQGVALDFSPTMLDAARKRFQGDAGIQVMEHNLDKPLPDLGQFDVIVSSFAIHHCPDARKRTLYAEIHEALAPGGCFYNLEHVAPATANLHEKFLQACGITPTEEDPSNKLVSVELQLRWLREIGFADVDCHWKWLELALFGGVKRG